MCTQSEEITISYWTFNIPRILLGKDIILFSLSGQVIILLTIVSGFLHEKRLQRSYLAETNDIPFSGERARPSENFSATSKEHGILLVSNDFSKPQQDHDA